MHLQRSRFTGKERDTESGNDYFGARYYSSQVGRFLSPDWSAKEEPVPYAKLDDPQSVNLYAYVRNNPLTRVDADGHQEPDCGCPTISFPNTPLNALQEATEGLYSLLTTGHMLSADRINEIENPGSSTPAAAPAQQEEKPEASPEPQTSTSGAGARQGGGRNAQKANPDRVQSVKDKVADPKGQRDKLASKPNKTPQDKADLKKLDNQIKQQNDRMKPSENHSQKGKGQ